MMQRLASKYTHPGKLTKELRRKTDNPAAMDIRHAHTKVM
jgi:hypothetical protein